MMSPWRETDAAPAERARGRLRRSGPRGPSDGPGPGGGGIAGYSREPLRGALLYAGRGIPVFPREAQGKRHLTADGFLETTTDGARIRGWWTRWSNALPRRSPRESARACSCSTWTPVKARTRWRCSNSPAASPRRPRAPRRVGGASIFPIPILIRVTGSWSVHAAGEEQPRASWGRPGRSRREGTCPAVTSWPRPAARCEPTGGSIGRLPPVPPGCSSV